jgi:hypothetical protein
MTALATIRPDDWNLPLFIHVLGALTLIGALVTAASYLFAARRDGFVASLRVGVRSLLLVALPAYVVMRIGAEWLYSKEGLDDLPSDPDWVGIGYSTADIGLLIILISSLAAWLGLRRARADGGGGPGLTIACGLVALVILMYGVAIWAMTTKPT